MKLYIFAKLCLNYDMKILPQLFNYEDVKELFPNKEYFYSYLSRSLKKGSIKQIKKGLYALIDPSTGSIYVSKYQIASKLFNDSYFSYHEALEYYGLANQSFVSHFTYLTHVFVDDVEFDGITYFSKKEECKLEIIDSIKENGIRVVTLERAIIDSINHPKYAGGIEEIENALENCRDLYIDKIINLLNYYNKSFLYQKVGYLFEKFFGNKIDKSFYRLCLSKSGKTIRYFECKKGYSTLNSKWKLMLPVEREMPDDLL